MNEKLDEMTRELLLAFDGTDPKEIDRLRNEWLAQIDLEESYRRMIEYMKETEEKTIMGGKNT